MTAQLHRMDTTTARRERRLSRNTAVSLLSGIVLGGLLNLAWQFPLLAAIGVWLVCIALALIGNVLFGRDSRQAPAWEQAIAGQVLGLIGLALFFLASLISL